MRKVTVGGNNEKPSHSILVIGGLHGDEPCGINAIESLLNEDISFNAKVTFIIANERAAQNKTRYVDTDLNRMFPTENFPKHKHTHEYPIAQRIEKEIQKADATLVFHSTHSTKEPFALFGPLTKTTRKILSGLSISKACKESEFVNGALTTFEDVIEIECGFQKSQDASDNAKVLLKEFLTITGAISSSREQIYTDVLIFERIGRIEKDETKQYTTLTRNFTKVEQGEAFVKTKTGGVEKADEDFYPVLLSSDGYESILGFKARQIGWLSELEE